MSAGILGYGTYLPLYRIEIAEIAEVWGKKSQDIKRGLGVNIKSISSHDEDAVTMAYEAGFEALKNSGVKPEEIDACFVGSESHPYAVNPTSTIIGELLDFKKTYFASDMEFACKAATTGMISLIGLIQSDLVKVGMAIGTDRAQAKPHDILEYTSASASAAFVLGKSSSRSLADIIDIVSFTSDTPDFWRRDGVRFPSHGGRFTGEPAYFAHIYGAATQLFRKSKTSPADYTYSIFHMPNGKFPRTIAKRLGFKPSQYEPSMSVDYIGNPYSASALIGLSKVLDTAKPKDTIFMVSYGSGAGADGFILKVNEGIKKRKAYESFLDKTKRTRNVSYVQYLKFTEKI